MVRNNCPYCFSTDCYGTCQSNSNNRWTPGYCPACRSSARCTNTGYCHQCQDYIVNIKKKMREAKEAEKEKDDEPETNDKTPKDNKEEDDPKEPEKKCEFCHRNNIEVKLKIEGKENLVCQSCYKSYKAKSEEDKD